jgi:hypothetical protein
MNKLTQPPRHIILKFQSDLRGHPYQIYSLKFVELKFNKIFLQIDPFVKHCCQGV